MNSPSARSDPDRFFHRTSPGAHEWWYFDAISDDGRDSIVIVWYAGLPFDPSFGVATLRHLKDPSRHPAPNALDHSAIGLSWYRDGKTMAYALNGYKADRFHHQAEPLAVEIGSSRVERDGEGYRLRVVTPTVGGKSLCAELRFRPAGATEPFERDLGPPGAPHHWILAAADCRVEGRVEVGGNAMVFHGRGYHDHNAGAEDLSVAIRRWEWGRFHHGAFTEVYYECVTRLDTRQQLWITCRDGRPETIRQGEEIALISRPEKGKAALGRTVFGIRHHRVRGYSDKTGTLWRTTRSCLDDGPFYRRWQADFELELEQAEPVQGRGMAELLDTRNLHKPWFNWMIPYRLKWPRI